MYVYIYVYSSICGHVDMCVDVQCTAHQFGVNCTRFSTQFTMKVIQRQTIYGYIQTDRYIKT